MLNAPQSSDRIRIKLITLLQQHIRPNLTGWIAEASKSKAGMLVKLSQPFLPGLLNSLEQQINEADPEQLDRLVGFLKEAAAWLEEDSSSSPMNESSS